MAVTTPTGISTGASSVRAPRSHATRNAAPNSAEAGSTMRWSTPTSSRTRCGTTMPMKPIGPASETAALVASDALKNASRCARTTSTPRVAAASGPEAQQVERRRQHARRGRRRRSPAAARRRSARSCRRRGRPSASVSPRYACAKSAMYCTNMISAEKNELSVTPASSSTAGRHRAPVGRGQPVDDRRSRRRRRRSWRAARRRTVRR